MWGLGSLVAGVHPDSRQHDWEVVYLGGLGHRQCVVDHHVVLDRDPKQDIRDGCGPGITAVDRRVIPEWRRWTGIEPAGRGSPVPPALKAGEPTRRSDTSTPDVTAKFGTPVCSSQSGCIVVRSVLQRSSLGGRCFAVGAVGGFYVLAADS